MDRQPGDILDFLSSIHPYDALAAEERARIAGAIGIASFAGGEAIYAIGQSLPGLYVVLDGSVEIRDGNDGQISLLGPRNSFGERGLLRGGAAVTAARAATDCRLLVVPVAEFHRLLAEQPAFARFFTRNGQDRPARISLATTQVAKLLTGPPITCGPEMTIRDAARLMRDRGISSLAVVAGGKLRGIVTTTDLSHRVVAEAIALDLPVSHIMTPNPVTLPPTVLASDVLHVMHERRIGHLPIIDGETLVGMVTKTDLTRLQAVTSAHLISAIAEARTPGALVRVTRQIPQLLVQLVGSGHRHEAVTRLVTDIADAATRRLLRLAEAKLGPPPVPYAWLACGSHGRRELTGVGEQDNGLLLDDRLAEGDGPYFDALARFVCEGLAACGYAPGSEGVLATAPRWRETGTAWRRHAAGWIRGADAASPVPATALFDLRVIGGDPDLFEALRRETLGAVATSPDFAARLVPASLVHAPPLGILRGIATIRSGEHKTLIDMKLNGILPVVDLARLHAVRARLAAVNTRARLAALADTGMLAETTAADLLDAYDLIAQTRLDHQARQTRRGAAPDDLLAPAALSDFERSHLRDAFVVVKTQQSALAHGTGLAG